MMVYKEVERFVSREGARIKALPNPLILSNFKVPVIRSEQHLSFVRSHDCLIERDGENCNGTPVIAHHFTFLKNEGGMSKKAADIYTVPLCFFHHGVLHHMGEKSFWKSWGFTLSQLENIAKEFCKQSPCSKVQAYIN